MTQKNAVYSAITKVFASAGVNFASSKDDASVLLTKDLRRQVTQELVTMFMDGVAPLSTEALPKLNSMTSLRSYASGLVNNCLRKDTRLNGGKPAEPADAQLKALRQLQDQQLDLSSKAEIQKHIDKRLAELS